MWCSAGSRRSPSDDRSLRASCAHAHYPAAAPGLIRGNAALLAAGENPKPPKLIIGAMMRKLTHVAFGVLRCEMPFDPALHDVMCPTCAQRANSVFVTNSFTAMST